MSLNLHKKLVKEVFLNTFYRQKNKEQKSKHMVMRDEMRFAVASSLVFMHSILYAKIY